ncbi:MAG: glutathione-regulated potassium-efflux system protein KefC [Polyangiaceae bacterium]|nr:glutathione-regulated potassium-efflux system protein KefC [Polyangiaceae bacterium]
MNEPSLLVLVIGYLGAAAICVPLAVRLGLGSVLGYLVAGLALGPYGLALFRDPAATLHFAELGVVLMLFVLGLELEPARLRAMQRAVFRGGAIQMAVCGLALTAVALVAGLPLAAAAVVGLAVALSSTAIAVQTMKERGILLTPLGQASFGVLLFQDIAAIPLLAVVPLLGEGAGGGEPRWIAVGKVLLAITAVLVLGRFATRPLLRVVARTGLREAFTATTLLIVLGVAEVMHLAGISMALGAFLAGVLLASSEYRHALEADIEPFKGLLMGLLFVAVGMSIDLGLIASRPLAVAGLVVALLAVKAAALWLAAPRIGVPRGQAPTFAGLLSQGGEFAFVVFGVAGAARLLPAEWEKLLTLAVALTMAATPLLVLGAAALVRRQPQAERRAHDAIEAEDAPVVIAGFGRFGQVVGRLLFASGLRATVLDADPDHVDTLRRYGFSVFYGDPTRLDLLEQAGVGRARVVVNAIDEPHANTELARLLHEHFPRVTVVGRARNVTHWFTLRKLGVSRLEREVFESSLRAGRHTLEALGVGAFEARERALAFRRHNLAALEALLAEEGDDEHRTHLARGPDDNHLEEQFRADVARLRHHGPRRPPGATPGGDEAEDREDGDDRDPVTSEATPGSAR